MDAPKGIPDLVLYLKLVPFIIVIWSGIYAISGLYRRSGSHRSAIVEAIDIIQASILATLAFIAFTYFYNEYRYSRLLLAIFAGLQVALVIIGRSSLRKFLRLANKHSPKRTVLIIGSGKILEDVLDWKQPSNEVLGGAIVVGDPSECESAVFQLSAKKIPIFAQPQDWVKFFTENEFIKVVIALPSKNYGFIDQNLELITDQVANIQVVPDLARFSRFAAGVEFVGGMPVIQIHDSPLDPSGMLLKRCCDILGAIFGILIFSPVLIISAILVRLSSAGPILYRQERMGIDGRRFMLFKFRSMPIDAEAKTGAIWAKAGDNRPTPVGKFLRKTSLDELPQLFNVLKGEMSLVGPRPERPVFVNDFRRKIPGYMLRHKVKAGLTGWAQVNGWRGNTSLEKRIECDLYYVQNWSLWLDIKIIILTIFNGFINKNAY